jgi:ArsR family transcriptional regulator
LVQVFRAWFENAGWFRICDRFSDLLDWFNCGWRKAGVQQLRNYATVTAHVRSFWQARICKAFAHPGRLQILDLLGQRELGVSELQEELGISKTSMSQHLSVLKSAGVLTTRRDGKQIYCSLAMPEVKQACQLIHRVLEAQIAASNVLVA